MKLLLKGGRAVDIERTDDGVIVLCEDSRRVEGSHVLLAIGSIPNSEGLGLDAAVRHIERFGSSHTEAIVTRDAEAARRFVAEVDSSTVVVNASTRFADGGVTGMRARAPELLVKNSLFGPKGRAKDPFVRKSCLRVSLRRA